MKRAFSAHAFSCKRSWVATPAGNDGCLAPATYAPWGHNLVLSTLDDAGLPVTEAKAMAAFQRAHAAPERRCTFRHSTPILEPRNWPELAFRSFPKQVVTLYDRQRVLNLRSFRQFADKAMGCGNQARVEVHPPTPFRHAQRLPVVDRPEAGKIEDERQSL